MKNYPIGISNGIFQHRNKIGNTIWEFMWLLDKVTRIDDRGVGWVWGGKPVKLEEIGGDLSLHKTTVSRNLNHLKKMGYIRVMRTPHGVKIGVDKCQKRFSKNATRVSNFATRVSENAKSNIRHNTDNTQTLRINNYESIGDNFKRRSKLN